MCERYASLLEKTFDERVQIGTRYRADELEKSDKKMFRNLEELWAKKISVEKKKELIFELWDECAESGGEQLVKGGTKAREALMRWVGVHLPEDSEDAFTEDELERFNARRDSKATFAPY
jgi:hypothetical protein